MNNKEPAMTGASRRLAARLNREENWAEIPLAGCVVVSITGGTPHDDEMVLTLADGRRYQFYHDQDCCETVSIADVVGDLADLIDSPIVFAEEVWSSDGKPGEDPEPKSDPSESYTWTFYRFWTAKGSVVVRWLGTSNGYYSESVAHGWMKTRAQQGASDQEESDE